MQKQTKMQIGFSGWSVWDEQHNKKETGNQGSGFSCVARTNRNWETRKRRVGLVKPKRGISGGNDCKDSESCLKSRFSWIYYFRISPIVLQCIFCQLSGLSEAERRWYANSMQHWCPFLWMPRNQFLHRDPFKLLGWASNLTGKEICYVVKTKIGTLFSPFLFLVFTLLDFGLWSWRF